MAWTKSTTKTLTGAGDNITTDVFTSKTFSMILIHDIPTGNTQYYTRLGYNTVDTGSNYAVRESYNGSGEAAVTSTSSLRYNASITNIYDTPKFGVGYIVNISSQEKLSIYHGISQQTAGAGTAPNRSEQFSKWANTSNQFNIMNLENVEAGDFNTDSQIVILGTD